MQRQYYKPYEESAFQYTAQGRLTSRDFTGQRLDADSGLLYYGARYYDPALSYFISPDSVVSGRSDAAALDLYGYTRNNPVRYNDPSGHVPAEPPDKESACSASHLGCTLDDFDKMTADERYAWLSRFAKLYGYGDAFNSILGVIRYFRDSHFIAIKPGQNWSSMADAGVLFAIQAGQILHEGGKVSYGGIQSPTLRNQLADAATDWASFFTAYKTNEKIYNGDQDKIWNTALLSRFGHAEQAGTDFGAALADDIRHRPGGTEGIVIGAIVTGSNGVRGAQRNGEYSAFTDPRDEEWSYRLAMIGENAAVFGACVVQSAFVC